MALDWAAFERLDGAPDRNFELLCRALVARNYGGCGQIRSKRQQPGVEFHMRLDRDCELGDAGRWYGWQCRWYDLRADNSFRSTQRHDIEEALKKAHEHVPDLTDFVLCLRALPAGADVDWYFGLETSLALHLWADEELEARLTGPAAVLRATYFDELVLTSATLRESRQRAITRVEQRWVPYLNVETSVERDVQLALARPGSALGLREQADTLGELLATLEPACAEIDDSPLSELGAAVLGDLRNLAQTLIEVAERCDSNRAQEARELAAAGASPTTQVRALRFFVRRMRARRVPASIAASRLEAEMRFGLWLLSHARECLGARLIAVVAQAGRGKTHLAAQLTAPSEVVPAGIFIPAGDRRAGASLDDLAVRIPGLAVGRFDDLMAAVDAAGARIGVRIPIVIDGLNESERPNEWRDILAALVPALDRYPNALVVVTLRDSLRDAVPGDTFALELDWPMPEVEAAVAQYFAHYLIDPGSARLPLARFRDPLFLRMYCEATNGDRQQQVGVESLPESLVSVFTLYRDKAAERLRLQLNFPPRYVERQLAKIALALWGQNTRKLPFEETKRLVDEDEREWERSLVRALEEEGVLWRHEAAGDDQESAILFDAFAGFLIADALLRDLGDDAATQLLSSEELWTKLLAEDDSRHPLAHDVFAALVGVVPRRLRGGQLWKLAPENARLRSLAETVFLDSILLDDETVTALGELIATRAPAPQLHRMHFFDRLWEVHDAPTHRLNARFLDRVLRAMPMSTRDLCWTEWLRLNGEELSGDVQDTEASWIASDERAEADDLAARAIAWHLASTSTRIRDIATRALCRYGRPYPQRLFELAADLLDINDFYVIERLLGASYGAATHHQMPDPGGTFERSLARYLDVLTDRYVGNAATAPTSHYLARHYVAGMLEFSYSLHPGAFPSRLDGPSVVFGAGPEPPRIAEDQEAAQEFNEIFYGTDFSNYVVGALYPDRGNYDFDHAGYTTGIAEIRGRVAELGWSAEAFTPIDRRLAEDSWRRQGQGDRTERYGKKYGWIAYYELAGRLDDRGELREPGWGPPVWPDIDPTFPAEPPEVDIELPAWAKLAPADNESWIRAAETPPLGDLLAPVALNGVDGPWILAEGHLYQRLRHRRVWGLFRSFLVDPADVDAVVALLRERDYLGNSFIPDIPEDMTTFAGEVPWSRRFAAVDGENEEDEGGPYARRIHRTWGDEGIRIELLAHRYAFSSERTTTDLDRHFDVPSKELASMLDLRLRPGTLDLVELDGHAASITRAAPKNFEGDLIFLRQDLLARRANGRHLVQIAWGERELDLVGGQHPEWMQAVFDERADAWRMISVAELD